jgi:hypothetical protein
VSILHTRCDRYNTDFWGLIGFDHKQFDRFQTALNILHKISLLSISQPKFKRHSATVLRTENWTAISSYPSFKAAKSIVLKLLFSANFPLTNKNVAVRTTGLLWLISTSLLWLLDFDNFNWATEIKIVFRHANIRTPATSNSLSCVDKLQKEAQSPAEQAARNLPWFWTLQNYTKNIRCQLYCSDFYIKDKT